MMAQATSYALLAKLVEYPEGDYRERAKECFGTLARRDDGVMATLGPFRAAVEEHSLEELQELFTRTFDINPVCTLEVGWHIYGEDYARGEFLVKMRQKLREHKIPESRELPDHLLHVLALLWRLESSEADDLAARYVLPAMEKMLSGLAGKENPFESLLEAIVKGVKSHHDVEPVEPRQKRGDPPGWSARLPMLGPEVQGESPCRIGGNGGGGNDEPR